MKKILLILTVVLASTSLSAQNVIDNIFERFKDAKNADYVDLDPTKKDSANQEAVQLPNIGVGKLTALQVLDLEECSQDIRDEFKSAVAIEDDEQYITLIKTKEDGEMTHILIRKEADIITEFIVIDVEEKDAVIVRMKGQFKQEDIDKLSKSVNK